MAETKKTSPIRKIVSLTVLLILVIVIILMFKRPKPLVTPMAPSMVASNAQSFQAKLSELEPQAPADSETPAPVAPEEVRFSQDEVQAALIQSSPSGSPGTIQTPSGEQVTLQAAPEVRFQDDVVKGQFEAEVAGQKVYVTVAGHLGAKDGYATFEPTEFRIGDMRIPVSLVNPQLQKKLIEQRDRLKLPDFIGDIAVQNGELVIRRK